MFTGHVTEFLRSADAERIPPTDEYSRHGRAVAGRSFARCAVDDVAGIPGVSRETARRTRRFANAWLECGMGKYNDAD